MDWVWCDSELPTATSNSITKHPLKQCGLCKSVSLLWVEKEYVRMRPTDDNPGDDTTIINLFRGDCQNKGDFLGQIVSFRSLKKLTMFVELPY